MGTIKPQRLLFFSFLIWLLFYISVEATYLYEGSVFFPVFTLILYIAAFLVGLRTLKKKSIRPIPMVSNRKIKQIVFIFFIIGAFGVLLKLYSGLFVSGIYAARDVFEQRLENMSKELSGGATGLIGSILFPFSYIALLITIYNYKVFSKPFLFLILVFGSYPFIETVFMGGRTIIALLGTTTIFVAYASFGKNNNIVFTKLTLGKKSLLSFPSILRKRKVLIPLFLIAFVFTYYSIEVINKRLERFNYGDKTLKVWEQKDYQWIEFNKSFKKDFFSSTEEEKAKMVGLHSLKHYFSHGVIEYTRLVNHLDKTTGYYYGMYEFYVFFKFFKALGVPIPPQSELTEIFERRAVYRTFWGDFYVDFGVFGFIIMFFWGRFIKRVYFYTKSQNTQYVIFYGYLSTLIITSFFINFLMGSSSYYLFAFIVTLIVFKVWPNNLKFVMKNA